jgi:hypothetical protein
MTARAPSLHGGESRLLIGQAHGYGGTQAGDCLMLESLSTWWPVLGADVWPVLARRMTSQWRDSLDNSVH